MYLKMTEVATENTTVLQGLGLFKIWTVLIITPFFVVALIVGMVVAAMYQKGWKTSTAVAVSAVIGCPPNTSNKANVWTCTVPVSVDELPNQQIDLKVDVDKDSVDIGHTWPVIFDPQKPSQTLTTVIYSNNSRTIAEVIMAVILIISVLFFLFNLKLRNNKTWQNISGVMQGADIASNIFGR